MFVRAFWLAFLPACQHMYLHTSAHPVRVDRICHQRVHVRCADRARMAYLIFLPDVVVFLLTVLQSFLTGEWHMMYCSNVVSGILVCERICIQEAWLWTAICREGGTFPFSAIRLKLAFSEISYCTFKGALSDFCQMLIFESTKTNTPMPKQDLAPILISPPHTYVHNHGNDDRRK